MVRLANHPGYMAAFMGGSAAGPVVDGAADATSAAPAASAAAAAAAGVPTAQSPVVPSVSACAGAAAVPLPSLPAVSTQGMDMGQAALDAVPRPPAPAKAKRLPKPQVAAGYRCGLGGWIWAAGDGFGRLGTGVRWQRPGPTP